MTDSKKVIESVASASPAQIRLSVAWVSMVGCLVYVLAREQWILLPIYIPSAGWVIYSLGKAAQPGRA